MGAEEPSGHPPRSVDSPRGRSTLHCMRFQPVTAPGTVLPTAAMAVLLSFSLGFVGAESVDPMRTLSEEPRADVRGLHAADTLTASGRRRAERLLETRVACLGCHTLDGVGGAIGPTLDGVGERLSAKSIRAKIANPQGITPGSRMPAQPLTPQNIDLLTELLASDAQWSGVESLTATAASDADPSGPGLYQQHCSSCHGIEGNGDGWNAANLPVTPTAHADATLMALRADDTLFDAIYAGGWVLDRSPRMPAFGELLTPDQIRTLVAHIRTLCDCTGPSWSRDGVGRSKGASR